MKMSHVNQGLRAIGLGLLFACLGFTLALATSGDASGRGTGLGNRAISTTCVRQPTLFVTDSDLGVVVVGSHFTRQILVQFGFKPHVFLFGGQKPTSTFKMSDNGEISGTKTDPGAESFEVRVFDDVYRGVVPPVSKTFTITGVASQQDPNLDLQFVNAATLPTAVANEQYTFTLQANGGTPPYTYEFKFDQDIEGFPAGLALNTETGEIFGKPVIPTPVNQPTSFTVFCNDALHAVASRTFNLTVLPGTISSDFVATGGNFRLAFGSQVGADKLKLTVVLNKTELSAANIRQTSDLKDIPIQIDFGGVSIPPVQKAAATTTTTTTTTTSKFPTKFDQNGSIRFPDVIHSFPPIKGNDLAFEMTLNPKTGVLKINASGLKLISSLGANFSTFRDPIIPLNIKMGSSVDLGTTTTGTTPTDTTTTTPSVTYDKTDTVHFTYSRKGNFSRGSALANTKSPPGGLFLISKVSGVEVKTGDTTDRLLLKFSGFMRGPRGAPITFQTGDNVMLHLGLQCLGEFPATSLKASGDTLTFRNDDASAGLQNLIIDNKKGTIYFDTHPILGRAAFGQDIFNGGVPLTVPIILTIGADGTLNPSFDGQSSVTVFRRGGHIQNK